MNDLCLPSLPSGIFGQWLQLSELLRAQCRYLSWWVTVLLPHRPRHSLGLMSHRVSSHGKLVGWGDFNRELSSGFIAKQWEQLCAILVIRHVCNCFAFIIVGVDGHANYVWESPQYPRHHICMQGLDSGSDEHHVCSLITPSCFLMNNYPHLTFIKVSTQ